MKSLYISVFFLAAFSVNALSGPKDTLSTKSNQCSSGVFSQSELDSFATIDEDNKRAYLSDGESVMTSLESEHVSTLCLTANWTEWSKYTSIVDYVKSTAGDQRFSDLSYGEIAFFTQCGNGKNLFGQNISLSHASSNLEGTLNGLTIGLVKSLGPLILEKGPNGLTPLEYAEGAISTMKKNKNFERYGFYLELKELLSGKVRFYESLSSEMYARDCNANVSI